MDNPAPHRDQDPDTRLAREIGRRLEDPQADGPLSRHGSDSFVELLLDYREEARGKVQISDDQSQKLWKSITGSTSVPRVKRLTSVRIVRRWAAGIAAGLALVVGLYSWLGNGGGEEYLLANASSSIELITLEDGSSITLRPHSSLFAVDLESRRYRLEGEALFEVTHDPDREFVVETAFASVTVLGTTFNVSTWGNETSVFLSRGKVRIDHSLSAQSLLLEPGQAAVVDRNMVSRALSDAADATYLDWLNSELSFDQSPSYRVAAELGHHFGVTLVIPADFANETLSGRILLTSLDQGLDDLSAVLGGRFEPIGDSTFVLAPD